MAGGELELTMSDQPVQWDTGTPPHRCRISKISDRKLRVYELELIVEDKFEVNGGEGGIRTLIALRLCLISSQVHSTGLCHLSVDSVYPELWVRTKVFVVRWDVVAEWTPELVTWCCSQRPLKRASDASSVAPVPKDGSEEEKAAGGSLFVMGRSQGVPRDADYLKRRAGEERSSPAQ